MKIEMNFLPNINRIKNKSSSSADNKFVIGDCFKLKEIK